MPMWLRVARATGRYLRAEQVRAPERRRERMKSRAESLDWILRR